MLSNLRNLNATVVVGQWDRYLVPQNVFLVKVIKTRNYDISQMLELSTFSAKYSDVVLETMKHEDQRQEDESLVNPPLKNQNPALNDKTESLGYARCHRRQP